MNEINEGLDCNVSVLEGKTMDLFIMDRPSSQHRQGFLSPTRLVHIFRDSMVRCEKQ
jgi:hypothetical protein